LEAADAVSKFRCGQSELDEWISHYALANQQSGMATVFVSRSADRIAGYYALSTGGVERAASEIGVRALLVHAKDANARRFYLRIAEFEESPTDPLHLFLLMKDLRRALGA
jgi:hypothetical protein